MSGRIVTRSRLLLWGGCLALALALPLAFRSGFLVSLLCQIGIMVVFALSYNMLLGQTGLLSFGHAVYYGLGAFATMHALNALGKGADPLTVALLPLAGGLAGIAAGIVLGYVTTRKAGTTFAMITLGVGELVFAMSLMVPEFFGGEGGVSGNRVMGQPFMGISFGPPIQVYYLIAFYTFLSVAGMYAFTRTPLGRMLNAVRDNPERVEFVGYNAQHVRYLAFIVAGFFAGVAGGLGALNFEIVTAEVVGAARSGAYLLFTFLGGATFFFGPIIGAVLMVLAFVLFSELTKAWLLYLGLIFMFMVMYAPGGIASLIMMNVRVARFGRLGGLIPHYVVLTLAAIVTLAGASALIEMMYQVQLEGSDAALHFLGVTLQPAQTLHWVLAAAVMLAGGALFEWARRRFARQWGSVQEHIEARIKQLEASA